MLLVPLVCVRRRILESEDVGMGIPERKSPLCQLLLVEDPLNNLEQTDN